VQNREITFQDGEPVAPVLGQRLVAAAFVALVVFLGALFGILTRSTGTLAAFWIANAVLLGIFVRRPDWANPLGWIAAVIGFLAADLVTGSPWTKACWLTAANLTSVSTGAVLFSLLDEEDRRLRRPMSVFYMCIIVAVAAAASAVVGALAAQVIFGGSLLQGFYYWLMADVVNYVAILPVILTMPNFTREGFFRSLGLADFIHRGGYAPLVALVIAALAAMLVGGPGAMTFPILPLLWCAVSFSVFQTTLLSLAFSAWVLLSISEGYLPTAFDLENTMSLLSLRLGVTLIALAPLAVASVMAARNELLRRLEQVALYDQLTGALRRDAFYARAADELSGAGARARQATVLMLDIDRFKEVNDTYGHQAGDRLLEAVASVVRSNIGKDALFGRLGGEEFAVLMPACTPGDALAIAQKIRAACALASVGLDDGRDVSATVSVGIAGGECAGALDELLRQADGALYRAKKLGRDRVEIAQTQGAI